MSPAGACLLVMEGSLGNIDIIVNRFQGPQWTSCLD
jgi:hypothetical protein